MRRRPWLLSGRRVAPLSRLAGLITLLLVVGCPMYVVDHNAFQTGKVLGPQTARLAFIPGPLRGSINLGLGRGWEVGAGYGRIFDWGRSADVSVIHSLHNDQNLFSSVLIQAELAKRDDSFPPLGRVTTASAVSYWPVEGFGIFVPLRLSMLLAPPVTFHYRSGRWNDSLGTYVYEERERVFRRLRDFVLTPGIGIAAEYKWFSARLAFNFPVITPNVKNDSANVGFLVYPFAGFQVGVTLP